jgi:GTP-binding protein
VEVIAVAGGESAVVDAHPPVKASTKSANAPARRSVRRLTHVRRPELKAKGTDPRYRRGRCLADFVTAELEGRGYRVFEVSAVSRAGLRELSFAFADLVKKDRETKAAEPVKSRIIIRPRAVNEKEFHIVVEGGTFGNTYRVIGTKPERWVAQTDFTNDEAVGFLADRLAKLGVEDDLFKAGAVPGSTVMIGAGGGVVFDWEPTMSSAAELITSPRGTDSRLDDNQRDTNRKRRQTYLERMDAKAAARAELEAERAAGIWVDDEGFAVKRDEDLSSIENRSDSSD